MKDEPIERFADEPAEPQQPLFSRPLGPENMNENQLRKLTDADRAFMNRVKNDGMKTVFPNFWKL